jgi:hypothetical protein
MVLVGGLGNAPGFSPCQPGARNDQDWHGFPHERALASMGMESVRGYQIAARVQNERGGVLGKKIYVDLCYRYKEGLERL